MDDTSEKISIETLRDQMQVGFPLPYAVLDSNGRLLLRAGHLLSSEAQFTSLIERGGCVERPLVEAERARPLRGKAAAPPVSLFEEWERLLWRLDTLTRALLRHEADAGEVRSLLLALTALLDVDPDVAIFRCVRHDDRRFALYPLTHALNCAVVAVLVGRQLNWSVEQVTALGHGALTMNLSIMELQATMAEQSEPPSAKQLALIRAHPQASAALLREAGVTDPEWLAIVAAHHEQSGGGGYPEGTAEVSAAVHVLRVIDVLLAKISPRAARPAMAPQVAIRQLFQQNSTDPLGIAVIKALGVHPPGSLLQLRSGEVAVATRRSASSAAPLAATLSDRQGRPLIDTLHRDTREYAFAVTGPLTDAKLFPRVLPERMYGFIAA